MRGAGGSCAACSAAEGPGMLVGVLVLLLLLGALIKFAQHSLWMQRALMERAVKTRILFGFVQVLTRIQLSYKLRLPASVVAFFARLAYIEIFDLSVLFGSMRCLLNHTYIERVYCQAATRSRIFRAGRNRRPSSTVHVSLTHHGQWALNPR